MPKLFTHKIEPLMLKNMKAFAHLHHATLNDVLLTVYAAALQEYVQKTFNTSMSIVPIRGAADLRKYLPPIFETRLKTTQCLTGHEYLSRDRAILFRSFMKLPHYLKGTA